MSDFQPASQQDLAGAGYGVAIDPGALTAGIQAVSALAQVGITAASAGSLQKKAQEHEKKMAKDYQALEKLKAKTTAAQGTVSSAQATAATAAASASKQKTLYIVGGSVAGVLVLAVTGYLIFRQPKKHKKRKSEEEEE